MSYLAFRLVHQTAVTLSITGFVARGLGALGDAAWVRHRLAKTVPHVVDAVLLGAAVGMLWTLHLTPLQLPWVMAKIAGLVAYVGLGAIALRPGRPWGVRLGAWLAALCVVAWIVSVAFTKQPLGFLAGVFA